MCSRSTLLKLCSMCCNTGDSKKPSQGKRAQSQAKPSDVSDQRKQLPARRHNCLGVVPSSTKPSDVAKNVAKKHLTRTSHAREQLIKIRQLSGAETLIDIHGYTHAFGLRLAVAAQLGLPRDRIQIIDPRNEVVALQDSEALEALNLSFVPHLQIIVRGCQQVDDNALDRSKAVKRLETELRDGSIITNIEDGTAVYTFANIPGTSITITDNDIFTWRAEIAGPVGTPYEGVILHCSLLFPFEYPFKPPEMFFNTKIYHCNVGSTGIVCMDILYDQWTPALTGPKLLVSVSSLLADPNPHDPIRMEAAELYLSDKAAYDARARECV